MDPPGRLLFKPGSELPPALSENCPIQTGLLRDARTRSCNRPAGRAGHTADLKILNTDQVKSSGEVCRRLLDPVLSAIRFLGTELGNHGSQANTTVRLATATRESSLQPEQPALFSRTQTGTPEQLAVGQSRRHLHATIHTNDLTVARCWNAVRDDRKRHVPSPGPILGYPVGLHVGHSSRKSEPHPSHLRYPDAPPAPIQPLDSLSLAAHDAEPLMSASPAPGRSTMTTTPVVLPRLVEVPQRLLLHGLRPCRKPLMRRASFSQLCTLGHVSGRGRSSRPPHQALFQPEVPDVSRVTAVSQQCSLLRRGWGEPVPGHVAELDTCHRQFLRREGPAIVPGLRTWTPRWNTDEY